jgi:hypothetical protein
MHFTPMSPGTEPTMENAMHSLYTDVQGGSAMHSN